MVGLLCFALAVLTLSFRSKLRLEAENAVLRHQLIVLRRRLHGRVRFTNNDRWFFIQLYRRFPSILQVLTILRPETLVRWHRAGFRCYWRWKSRPLGGRPQIETELRVPVPGLGAVWPAIVVGITVFFLVIVASIDLLSVVPANVYGYERSNRSVIVIAALRRRVTGEHKPP